MSLSRLGIMPPLPVSAYARRRLPRLPFPLGDARCRLYSRGRHGLWHGLSALSLRPGEAVLVPAYHHGSEIEALARAGLRLDFYEATETLEPREAELELLVEGDTRALYLIHYLGFPQNAARWRAWCDERRLLLIEDAAQGWLGTLDGRPLGSFGDLALFCLYKTVGVPDGGAAVWSSRASGDTSRGALALGPLARRHAAALAARTRLLARLGPRLPRSVPYDPEADFALGDPHSVPAAPTRLLLPRIADPLAAARRRGNYRVLLDELGDTVATPFRDLPAGASPFVFPVATERKAELLERLAAHGISALDVWSAPHPTLPVDRFPGAARLRATVVGLPVHQELRPDQLERIAAAARGRRRSSPRLAVEPAELDAAPEEWSALAERTRNVFATPEFLATWWRHFGEGRRLELRVCRKGGRLVAVLPLYLARERPLRLVRVLGHGPGDELGPVCHPAERVAAAAALRETLAALGCDLFVGEQLPADRGWHALLGGRVLRREGSPVLRFRGRSWDELLEASSKSFRDRIRSGERRLARDHELRYRSANDPARLQEDLGTLFALHEARWQGGESAFTGPREAFHRDFAERARERGWLRLSFLELDGRAVAAWYGFRFHGVESYYQAGRDPAWNRAGVGFVLLAHSVRAALEDGMDEYRFLRGGEEYKYRFTSEDPGLETIGVSSGALGRLALTAAALRPLRRVAARAASGPP